MKKTTFLILLGLVCLSLSAQVDNMTKESVVIAKDSCSIYFKVAQSAIDEYLQINKTNIGDLKKKFVGDVQDSLLKIDIYPYTSLDGGFLVNKKLMHSRGLAVEKYLEFLSSSVKIENHLKDDPYDWNTVRRYISNNDFTNKESILEVIDNEPAGQTAAMKKHRFMGLLTQSQWYKMADECFPLMRRADIIITYKKSPIHAISNIFPNDTIVAEDDSVVTHLEEEDTNPILQAEEVDLNLSDEKDEKSYLFALKTNLLYDAALIPNLGVEIPIKKGWTIGGNWMYAWWSKNSKHRYWRIYGGELEVRKYLGQKYERVLAGHHIGLYLHGMTYDFETGGKGWLSNFSYGGGIEYGYSLPIAKRLNLDFGIGIGYWGGEYKVYEPIDEHYVWQETKNRHWVGPTKVEISLVWLLGKGYYNSSK